MPGRVVAVAIAVLLTETAALPQCTFTPVRSAQFRSSALDLAVDGNDVWVATSYGVSLYDRTVDPPKLTASIAIPGVTRVVRAQGGIAYVGSGTSLVVVQKNGAHLLKAGTPIDIGGTVNDILATTLALYVAATNGVTQYDLVVPTAPAKTTAKFPTSRTETTSLALLGTTLYIADGDSSVEAFDVGTAVALGALTAGSPVTVVRVNNGKVYGSGPVSTYVFENTFTTPSRGAMTALAPLSADTLFLTAGDRRLRAVDFTLPGAPVELFRSDLPATGGTINRIGGLASAANRLLVAGGDAGLLTYDITGFASPFPIHGYATGGATSILSTGDRVFVARDTGGVTEFSQSPSATLTQRRSWDGSRNDLMLDSGTDSLLTSSGTSMTLWTLISSSPQSIASTTFRAPVTAAALVNFTAYALLADRTLWSADFTQVSPTPKQIALNGTRPSLMSRSGTAVLLAELRDDGNTVLSYFATPDFSQQPKTLTVPGVAVTGVTLSGTTAAVLTFRGINIADFASMSTSVLPQSVTNSQRAMIVEGTRLYELTDTSLVVWDLQKQRIATQYPIPGDPVALHIAPSSSIVDVATGTGIATIATNAASRLPAPIATPNPNVYYKRVASTADRLYFFDGRNVDIYESSTLRFTGGVRTPVADVAANDIGAFTVSNALVVTAYTPDGVVRASATINEGADAQPVSIRTVGSAVWVSIIRGCSKFACEKKTIVFDPRNGLGQTATMTGAVVDVVTNATRAYVLTDLPFEVRVVDINDPFHPSTIVSAPVATTSISIAYANATVYVLGDKLTAYAESTLTPLGDILGSYTADPTGVVTAADQRLRIDGSCAVVTGRSFSPQLFTIASATQWAPAASFPMPSATRSVSAQPGVIHFLTDHSLETWSVKPLSGKPPRHRAVISR